MNKGDIVIYHNKKAKIIGKSNKAGTVMYKLKIKDDFNTIVNNVYGNEITKFRKD